MRGRAARMHDPLGDALVIEARDLLAEMKVVDKGRSAHARLERVVRVREREPLIGREDGAVVVHPAPFEICDLGVA